MPANEQIIALISERIRSHAQEDKAAHEAEVVEKTERYTKTFVELDTEHTANMVALDANYTSLSTFKYQQHMTDLEGGYNSVLQDLQVASDGAPVSSLKEANKAVEEHNEKYNSDLAAAINTADARYDAYVTKVGRLEDFTAEFTYTGTN